MPGTPPASCPGAGRDRQCRRLRVLPPIGNRPGGDALEFPLLAGVSFRRVGLPDDVFRTLLIGSRQVDAVIENDRGKAVTFTGSARAGGKVAAAAGRMLKKTVMELGVATLVFGLGGSIWTRDSKKGEEVAERLEAGVVFVNGQVRSDPRLPFGGVKGSGYGRELSHYGIREFVNIQTVRIR